MSKYRFCLLALSAVSAFALRALDCTPGALQSLVSSPGNLSTLSVKGQINAADLEFIAGSMPALRTLDLGEAEIVKFRTSATIYPDAVVPAKIFAGAPFTSVTLPRQQGLIIEEAAFAGAGLTSLTIGSNVKSVGTGAFAGCADLKNVSISSPTVYGTDVFNGCTSLTAVNLGDAAEVSASMFANCPSLTAVSGGEQVVSIAANAFAGDAALTSFPFAAALTSIGEGAFTHSGLEEAQLQGCKALTAIGDRAFAQAPALRAVTLPSSVKTLGTGIFAMDGALADLTLSTAITVIPDYAFTSTGGVADDKVLHSGVTEIGAYALKGHSATETLFIPRGVTYIGDHAMEGMTGLKTVDVSEHTEAPELGSDVWAGVVQADVELKVGEHMADVFRNAAQWQDFSIKSPTVLVDDIVAEEQQVKARFDAYTLEIVSTGAAVTRVELYNTAGQLLTALSAESNSVSIDTQSWQENIYIASVTLADGTRATAKLLRLI